MICATAVAPLSVASRVHREISGGDRDVVLVETGTVTDLLSTLWYKLWPCEWATTQDNLATVLFKIGEREQGTARLEEAVAGYRAVLDVRTLEPAPLDSALIQYSRCERVLVSEIVFEGCQQKGAESSTFRIGPGKEIMRQDPDKESLRHISTKR